MRKNPEMVDVWKRLDDLGDAIPNGLKRDTDALQKIKAFDDETGRFAELGDELKNIPDKYKKGWVDHLEQRTLNGRVRKAGDNADKYLTFKSDSDIPSRYTDDSRFKDLSKDPDRGSAVDSKSRQEAMAGLEAESQGLVSKPISRDPNGAEFIDGFGNYWDVKGPRSGFMDVDKVGDSIKKELTRTPHKVILDCTWINAGELQSLRSWLSNNLSASDLAKIVEVNSNLIK